MGWNSWNCFGCAVTAEKVKAAADAMVASGLIDHGWTYINIDDYWEVKSAAASTTPRSHGPERDAQGSIVPNPRFPDMKGLVDYIHAKGLKAGIYSSPGPLTCGGCVASWQHEEQDAQPYAEWGFDYLKYDWCSYGDVAPPDTNTDDRHQQQPPTSRVRARHAARSPIESCAPRSTRCRATSSSAFANTAWATSGNGARKSAATAGARPATSRDNWRSMSGNGFRQAATKNTPAPATSTIRT